MENSEGPIFVGKLVKTDYGAIWSIPRSDVVKMKKSEEGTYFRSDKYFRTVSGFWFGLDLTSPEGGKGWGLQLINGGEVPVKLKGTVIIQQETEMDVKVSGLPGGKSAGFKVQQLFADTRRGLVVEVRMSSCEQHTVGGVPSMTASSWRAVAATKGELAAQKETWSLEWALANLGEDASKEKVKKGEKSTKKEKRKQKVKESLLAKKVGMMKEENYEDEDTVKQEERCRELEGEKEGMKVKLMIEEEEVEATKTELSQALEEEAELAEELRRSRRREEHLRGCLAKELRSRELLEKNLMEQVAEEEGMMRRLKEPLRQVAQASPRLLQAATRPVAAHTKEEQEEQEAMVVPSTRNLGAIPKTRAATTKQVSSKMSGASSSPSSKAQKSVERMVKLLEGRGRLASLPTHSLRHLVANLRARLGGLSDLSLSYVEQEVARMAAEEV